jgi:hypothetical protein
MFSLDESQKKKLDEWVATKDLSAYGGAIGGRFTYCFTQTSLGEIVQVIDGLDNTKIDLTDYSLW